jgi:ABC-type protease/lipase transport system fused ATPase/permease subunit
VRLVVLDEPNSNLDGDGERALMQTLHQLKQAGITVIVVAHRPSIVQTMDKILMLRGGMVEAFGPRAEILARYSAPAPRANPPRTGQENSEGGSDGPTS